MGLFPVDEGDGEGLAGVGGFVVVADGIVGRHRPCCKGMVVVMRQICCPWASASTWPTTW
jgi:hypothetical protein